MAVSREECKNTVALLEPPSCFELFYVSGVSIDDMIKRFLDKFKIDFSQHLHRVHHFYDWMIVTVAIVSSGSRQPKIQL